MAKATVTTFEEVTLKLTLKEARAIRDILGSVGGDNRDVDAVREAFNEAGIKFRGTYGILRGSIYFEENLDVR